MKKSRLHQIIREEIKNVLTETKGYTVVYRDKAFDKTYTAQIPPGISKAEIKQMLKRVVRVGLEIINISPIKESVNEIKIGNKINSRRARSQYKTIDIMAIDKKTGEQVKLTDETSDLTFLSSKYIFAYIDYPKGLKESVNEASTRDPESIRKEYKDLKKRSISYLRQEWSRMNKVGDPKGTDKDGLISDILRGRHGNKYVAKAFNLKESYTSEWDPETAAKNKAYVRNEFFKGPFNQAKVQKLLDKYANTEKELMFRSKKDGKIYGASQSYVDDAAEFFVDNDGYEDIMKYRDIDYAFIKQD